VYREIARDRDGAVVSICESPDGSGRCPPDHSTRTLVTLDPRKRITRVDGPDVALDGNAGSNPNLVSIAYDAADRRKRLVRARSAADPWLGPAWSWTHDANGNVVRALDPSGADGDVRYAYDALGRLRFKDFPPHSSPPYRPGDARRPGDFELRYDEPGVAAQGLGGNLGRLTSERTDSLERRHDTSRGGRRQLSTSVFTIDGHAYAFPIASEVDALGRPSERAFPDGERLRFRYSGGSNGSVELLRHGGALAEDLLRAIRTHPSGAIESFTHARPGITVTRSFELAQAQRLGSIRTQAQAGSETQLLERDRAGNLIAIYSGAPAIEQVFWYDGMNRLVRSLDAREPAAEAVEYAFDAAGNLIRKGDAALGYGGDGALPDAVTRVRPGAYGGEGQPTLEDPCPSYAGESPTNDPNGDGIPTECQCGDITRDGRIDVSDLVSEGRCIFQPGHPTHCAFPRCDANHDARCDVRDLVEINRAIYTTRHHELRCALRPEGQPVWRAEQRYARAADGSVISRDLGSGGRTDFQWDAEGRLVSASGAGAALYAYDAQGQRILERSGGAIRLFVSPEYEVDLAAGAHEKHVFLGGTRQISIAQTGIGTAPGTSGGQTGERRIHHFSDALGMLRWASDASGARLQQLRIAPWGEPLALSGAAGEAQARPVTPYLFAGHRLDDANALYYMGARYYDPRIGAFLSVDPAWLDGEALTHLVYGSVHLNAFAYAAGQPTQRVDPDGRFEIEFSVWSGQGGAVHSYGASSAQRFAFAPVPTSGCNWAGSCTAIRFDPRTHIIVNFSTEYHGAMIYEMARRAKPHIPSEMARGIRDGSLWMDDCETNFANCPFNFPDGTRKHFVDRGTALRELNETIEEVEAGDDPYEYGFRVGAAIHPYSDSTPHGPYRWYLLGHLPRDAFAMGWNATIGRIPGAHRFKMTDDFDPDNPAHVQQQRDDQRAIDRAGRRYCAKNACP
jgi:RHS repeat-associated protein